MPYDFFFSYRRADFGPYMRDFFTDLSEEVRHLRGMSKDESPAFFDQESIETGNNWDTTLLSALQQSRVLVPLYSPAYFKSEYCGKEWQSFHLRRQAYAQQHGGDEPAVIKPVIWVPIRNNNSKLALPEAVSDPVKRVQYTWKEEESDINQQGLEQIVRLKTNRAEIYWNFIRDFAEQIKNAIEVVALPPLTSVPELDDVPSAFNITNSGSSTARPSSERLSFRRHVRFIFAALDPLHIGAGRNPGPYQDIGGPDWKPFYPEKKQRIGSLAAHIVSDADLEFDSDYIELTDNLADAVQSALQEGKPVVVFLDRWSLYISQNYQQIFRQFDQRNFDNCAVLLPWNPADPELAAQQQNIDQVVTDVLHFRNQYAHSSPYYCKQIGSLNELSEILRTVLNQLQAEMRRRAPVRPVVGCIPRPTVTGPGRVAP